MKCIQPASEEGRGDGGGEDEIEKARLAVEQARNATAS